jgi:hypothetical protein
MAQPHQEIGPSVIFVAIAVSAIALSTTPAPAIFGIGKKQELAKCNIEGAKILPNGYTAYNTPFNGHMATGASRSDYPAKESWSKVPPFYEALAADVCSVR